MFLLRQSRKDDRGSRRYQGSSWAVLFAAATIHCAPWAADLWQCLAGSAAGASAQPNPYRVGPPPLVYCCDDGEQA
eukprot:388117-Pyramimonas_sp.AAC.1